MAYLYSAKIITKDVEVFLHEKECTIISEIPLTKEMVETKIKKGEYDDIKIKRVLNAQSYSDIEEIPSIVEMSKYTVKKIKEL